MVNAQKEKNIEEIIINLEKSALDKWYKNDPSGYIDLCADDVVYFDPYIEKRIDTRDKLTEYYEPFKKGVFQGKIEYEFINPKVQWSDNMAVLTFNLRSGTSDNLSRWNCTEVYRLEEGGKWKIIQSHWSLTTPELK